MLDPETVKAPSTDDRPAGDQLADDQFGLTCVAGNTRATKTKQKAQRGYSLLEILVVLAIIGVLATLVGPRLFNQVDRSKITAAKAQARFLKTSLEAMYLDIGRYPNDQEGLSLLVTPPSDPGLRAQWAGPYIDGDLPVDPWGNPYRYEQPGQDAAGFNLRVKVVSLGADNEVGGTGLNQDIEA
ncbi:MAG: type II secretion system major pseudopilin GspG [Pseudomonadota bacterium]